MAYAIFGEEKYRAQYESLAQYGFSRFPDKKYGEWFGYLHYDGTLANLLKGNLVKGPFHLPRMLMLLHHMEQGSMLSFFS